MASSYPGNHYINLDGGPQEFRFDVWQECSDIPIFPQGGTWLFDRAGWCPGDPSQLNELELKGMVQPGQQVTIDYGVNGTHMDEANYLVAAQLVSYGPINKTLDAELHAIVKPSNRTEFMRYNPACNEPEIILRNTGSEVLTSVDISYGVVGGEMENYHWTGRLGFLESENVKLPITNIDFWASAIGQSDPQFVAVLSNPNSQTDTYTNNDRLTSTFEVPKVFNRPLRVKYTTNNNGFETSYTLRDRRGNILYSRDFHSPNTSYEDNLDIAPGCYTLEFHDSADDGLYYWFWEQTGQSRGRGSAALQQELRPGLFVSAKTLEPEFGRFIRYDFGFNSLTPTNDPKLNHLISTYPNPVHDVYNVHIEGDGSTDIILELTDVSGRTIQRGKIHGIQRYFRS